MEAFKQAGGRLFRIALLFTIVCVAAMVIMTIFTNRAMNDALEIATTPLEEGEELPDMSMFYVTILNNMKIQTVIASLSGVLIAIAARYGLRESTKNIGEGLQRTHTTVVHEQSGDSSRTSTSEEVEGK